MSEYNTSYVGPSRDVVAVALIAAAGLVVGVGSFTTVRWLFSRT